MTTQAKIYKVLHENRSPTKLFDDDDRNLWDLAGEIGRTKDERMKEITERLINNQTII